MTVVQAAGFEPNTVALSPADAEALDLELLDILNLTNTLANWGLQIRIGKSVTTGFVFDRFAFATVHASPISVAAFEENERYDQHAACTRRIQRDHDRRPGCRRSGARRRGVGGGAAMKLYKVEFAGGGAPAYLHLDDEQVADWRNDERVKKVSVSKQADADAAAGIVPADQPAEEEAKS